LGFAPPSNAYLIEEDLDKPETYYPLRVQVCHKCYLVQTRDYVSQGDVFKSDYSYFSSTSSSWLEHARRFAEKSIVEFALNENSLVIEVASNDGYLLTNYMRAGIGTLGIEPTASTAQVAIESGIKTIIEFLDEPLALSMKSMGQRADLLIGNNVYAHVPDINDFTAALAALLKPEGCLVLEFPHILMLLQEKTFDTIYHEHFSYHSLRTVTKIFEKANLRIWKVEELKTHGGSLRVYGCHSSSRFEIDPSVELILEKERGAGIDSLGVYTKLQEQAEATKNVLLEFLISQRRFGKKVVAYGAAAKGNTLLNFAGVKRDLIDFVADAAPAKQGKYLPGSHIPIFPPEILLKSKPDYILILPWNLKDEISLQFALLRSEGTKFVIALPELRIF
jgi:SAM-dependent methyltransferase